MVHKDCSLANGLCFTSIASLCSHTQVVDTPYICDKNRYSEEDMRQQISQWKEMTSPGPSAILLALNGKYMFTTQRYEDYQKLKTLWGEEDFCRRLIVIFTFADRRLAFFPGKSLEKQLETAVPNLKSVLDDARNYYMEVNNTASQEENVAVVKEILDCVERKGKVVQYVQLVMLSNCSLIFFISCLCIDLCFTSSFISSFSLSYSYAFLVFFLPFPFLLLQLFLHLLQLNVFFSHLHLFVVFSRNFVISSSLSSLTGSLLKSSLLHHSLWHCHFLTAICYYY